MKFETDNVAADVKRLAVLGKPKPNTLSKTETGMRTHHVFDSRRPVLTTNSVQTEKR